MLGVLYLKISLIGSPSDGIAATYNNGMINWEIFVILSVKNSNGNQS